MNITPTFRKFHLQRHSDASGVSGLGRVAEGIVFSDGKAVLHWLSACSSTNIYDNWEAIKQIHGHGGDTEIVFDDPEPDSPAAALETLVEDPEERKKVLAVAEEAIKAHLEVVKRPRRSKKTGVQK